MMRLLAHRLRAAQRPTAGTALQRVWGALYGAKYLHGGADCHVAKAPARGGGRALRGGVQARLDPARGYCCARGTS
jgi:hypothetical protein